MRLFFGRWCPVGGWFLRNCFRGVRRLGLRYQARGGELRFADAVGRVTRVLRGDVNPLMDENVRDGLGHGASARIIREAEGGRIEHLCHAGAIDVDVRLDRSLHAQNPSQRSGLEWAVGLLDDIATPEEPYFDHIGKLFPGN